MAKECFAPVFEGNNIFACLLLVIVYTLAILGILIGTLFLCLLFPSCRCTIKQYQFRIANCVKGNSQPNIPL